VTQPPHGYGPPPGYGYGPPPGYGYGPPPGYGYGYGYGPPPGYGYGYGYGAPRAPRPGCVPLRPLGVGDILDGTFTMIRRNPRVMLGMSATVAVLHLLLVAVFEVIAINRLGGVDVTSVAGSNSAPGLGSVLSADASSLVTFVAGLVLGSVLTGMLTIAITQDVIGVRLSFGQAWARVRPRIWPLLGLVTVTLVLEFLGLIPCLVLGVWLWGIWAVAVPAFMVEGTTIRGALGRSRALVSGTFWRVWGIRALGTIIASVIGGFISAPFLIVGLVADSNIFSNTDGNRPLPVLFLVLVAIGSAVSATFTAPIRAGIDALLYIDLRMRKEGLDIVLQQSVAGPAGGPGGPGGPRGGGGGPAPTNPQTAF
jgi:hypothetical protein